MKIEILKKEKKDQNTTFALKKSTMEKLKRLAKENEITINEFVNQMIDNLKE